MNIEKLKAAFDELKKDADIAYCRYIDICDKECRGTEYHLEKGTFSQQMLESYKLAYDMYGFHRGIHKALKEVRTILDQAINAPDLDATIARCIEHAKRDWKEGAFGYNEAEIVVDTVRLLAPRIVRDGFVVVKKPEQWMINQYKDFKERGEIMRHNEEGMEALATILAEAVIDTSNGEKNE